MLQAAITITKDYKVKLSPYSSIYNITVLIANEYVFLNISTIILYRRVVKVLV